MYANRTREDNVRFYLFFDFFLISFFLSRFVVVLLLLLLFCLFVCIVFVCFLVEGRSNDFTPQINVYLF